MTEPILGRLITAMVTPFDAEGEVDFAADITEYYADHIDKITGDVPLEIDGDVRDLGAGVEERPGQVELLLPGQLAG